MKKEDIRNIIELIARKIVIGPSSVLSFKIVKLSAARVPGRVAFTIGSTRLSLSLLDKNIVTRFCILCTII